MTANGVATSTVTVTLRDAQLHPISGKTVTLAKGSGSSTHHHRLRRHQRLRRRDVHRQGHRRRGHHLHRDRHDRLGHRHADRNRHVHRWACDGRAVDGRRGACLDRRRRLDDSSTVTVTLKDANSNPVSGKTVTQPPRAAAPRPSPPSPASRTAPASRRSRSSDARRRDRRSTPRTDTTDSITVAQTATVTFTGGPVTAAQSTGRRGARLRSPQTASRPRPITVTLLGRAVPPASPGKTVTLAKARRLLDDHDRLRCHQRLRPVATFTVKDTVAEADDLHGHRHDRLRVTVTQTATVTFHPAAP